MANFNDELLKRRKYLSVLANEAENRLNQAPRGKLNTNSSKGRVQYFVRKGPKDRQGTYIPKKEQELVRRLAQKDYDEKLLKRIRREIKSIDGYLKTCPQEELEAVYEKLNESRRGIVEPAVLSDEMYLQRWLNMEFNKKGFEDGAPEFITDKGERVRSKSEMIIANLLAKLNVPYLYEVPLFLNGFGNVYTDFRVLDLRQRKEYYWEHLGMMDNSNYADRNVRKIAAYELNGFFQGEKLIVTYETKNDPLNMRHIHKIIEHYFL